MEKQDLERWVKYVLTKKKDVVMIKWTLDIQECGLPTSLQQLKMTITKLTQIQYSKMECHAIVGGIGPNSDI
jgi:hypothetical protein